MAYMYLQTCKSKKSFISCSYKVNLNVQIYLSEASDDSIFDPLPHKIQRGADLGERMHHAFVEMLQQDSTGAIIMGSDCLDFSPSHIDSSTSALLEHDLVLQPSIDGGYTLIGCRTAEAALFHQVEWSTSEVLAKTTANAKKLGYRIQLLETVRDIDTLQDMEHYPELRNLSAKG